MVVINVITNGKTCEFRWFDFEGNTTTMTIKRTVFTDPQEKVSFSSGKNLPACLSLLWARNIRREKKSAEWGSAPLRSRRPPTTVRRQFRSLSSFAIIYEPLSRSDISPRAPTGIRSA